MDNQFQVRAPSRRRGGRAIFAPFPSAAGAANWDALRTGGYIKANPINPAFTLATKINVLPMVIYTEFTLQAHVAMAAALSFVLGAITWAVLALAPTVTGNSVAAAG